MNKRHIQITQKTDYHDMCSKICLPTCMLHATTNKYILLSDTEMKVVFLKLQVQ